MRVLHVNIARGFRGGERQTQLLIEALSRRGVKQGLLARYDSPLLEKLQGAAGLELVPVRKPYLSGLFPARRFKPDIVHGHDGKAAQWAYLNYLVSRTPYVLTRRVTNPLNDVAFTRAVYRNAAQVVGLSRAVRETVRMLLPGLHVEIIPSMYASLPVDRDKLEALRARYRDAFVIGHIGALVSRQKGQGVLIEAARMLLEKYPQLRFLLLGDGEDERRLKREAAGCPQIEFIGYVQDVGTWIEAFDLFVFPSFGEGLGSTLLDIMQHGRAIVASGVDGILDVIDNERNGLLVPTGDAGRLATAIERLYLDAPLRRRLVEQARQDLGRYSPVQVAECYHKLYESILGSGESVTSARDRA